MKRRLFRRIVSLPMRWRHTQRELDKLNSRLLRDIGFERFDDGTGGDGRSFFTRMD